MILRILIYIIELLFSDVSMEAEGRELRAQWRYERYRSVRHRFTPSQVRRIYRQHVRSHYPRSRSYQLRPGLRFVPRQ